MQRVAGTVQRLVWRMAARRVRLGCMGHSAKWLMLIAAGLLVVAGWREIAGGPGTVQAHGTEVRGAGVQAAATEDGVPQYTADGELKFPEHYRDWVYLTSGFNMSYNPAMRMGMDMFDNVFVNPASYRAFMATGTWPDKTMFVLEGREGKNKGSINQHGSYQNTEVMGLEVHVKDEARFGNGKKGGSQWAFFSFDDGKVSKMIPTTADCYSCHAAHAAVDTTFVQFYPTLLPVAREKKTLSANYLKEVGDEKPGAQK